MRSLFICMSVTMIYLSSTSISILASSCVCSSFVVCVFFSSGSTSVCTWMPRDVCVFCSTCSIGSSSVCVSIERVLAGILATAHCLRTAVEIDDIELLLVGSMTSARPHVPHDDPDPMNLMADWLLLVSLIASAYDRPSLATI